MRSLTLGLKTEDLLGTIDRAPTGLADGLASARTAPSGARRDARYGRGWLCTRRPIRPGRRRGTPLGKWVPRSPPHRAGAIRQVDFGTRGTVRVLTGLFCELRHTGQVRNELRHTAASLQEFSPWPTRPSDRPRQLVPAPRARRDAHARGRVHGVRRRAARRTTSSSTRSSRACTWCPATVSGSRSCRSTRAGRYGWTTRTSTSAFTSATPPCRSPAAISSSSGWPGACSRRRSTAAGRCGSCGSSRACPTIASRSCQKPITRSSTASPGVDIVTVLFDSSPDPMPVSPPEQRVDPSPAAERCPVARRRAARARDGARRDRPRRQGDPARPASGRRPRRQGASAASARSPAPVCRRRPRARSTSGSARTGASPGFAAT